MNHLIAAPLLLPPLVGAIIAGLVLGYLALHTRQMDMIMSNPAYVEHYRAKYRRDIERLMPMEKHGVFGVIAGKALYTGALSLAEAIASAKGAG